MLIWSNLEPDVDIVTSCKCSSSTQCHCRRESREGIFRCNKWWLRCIYDFCTRKVRTKSIDTKKTIYVLSLTIYLVGLFHTVKTTWNWSIFFVVVKWFLNNFFVSFIQNERCIKPFIDTCDFDNDGSLSTRGKDKIHILFVIWKLREKKI